MRCKWALASLIRSSKASCPRQTLLFLEFHGSNVGVADQVAQVTEIFRHLAAVGSVQTEREEERRHLWKARHDAYHAARSLQPGKDVFATDACVPISRLAECIAEARDEADASGLLCPLVGHVGDGNFHLLVLYDPTDANERRKAEGLSQSIARRAIRYGGTCTGERAESACTSGNWRGGNRRCCFGHGKRSRRPLIPMAS